MKEWRRVVVHRVLIQLRVSGIVHICGLNSVSLRRTVIIGAFYVRTKTDCVINTGLRSRTNVWPLSVWAPNSSVALHAFEATLGSVGCTTCLYSLAAPVFSYRMRKLMDPTSPWWVVA